MTFWTRFGQTLTTLTNCTFQNILFGKIKIMCRLVLMLCIGVCLVQNIMYL
uniref:Uncharacterized protein n=1 Tax=Arundo donax TaxID=35708 RepID=A0A0A9B1U2_ARUDO